MTILPVLLTLLQLPVHQQRFLVVFQKSRQKTAHPPGGWDTLEGTYGKATENVVTRALWNRSCSLSCAVSSR